MSAPVYPPRVWVKLWDKIDSALALKFDPRTRTFSDAEDYQPYVSLDEHLATVSALRERVGKLEAILKEAVKSNNAIEQEKRNMAAILNLCDVDTVKKYREALEYYADTTLGGPDATWDFLDKFQFMRISSFDVEEIESPETGTKYWVGGKRARQALTEQPDTKGEKDV